MISVFPAIRHRVTVLLFASVYLGSCGGTQPKREEVALVEALQRDLAAVTAREAAAADVKQREAQLERLLSWWLRPGSGLQVEVRGQTAIVGGVRPEQTRVVQQAFLSGNLLGPLSEIEINGVRYARSNIKSIAFPDLPWPPPPPSSVWVVPRQWFSHGPISLAAVADVIGGALSDAGYSGFAYFRVPGGFAVVTPLEQIRADGEPVAAASRCRVDVPPLSRFSLREYAAALIRERRGHYRSILFIVSSHAPTRAPRAITSAEVDALATTGGMALPFEIASQHMTAKHRVWALVYEFTKSEDADGPEVTVPGRISCKRHLEASGVLRQLSGHGDGTR